jgi:hypothetical protein
MLIVILGLRSLNLIESRTLLAISVVSDIISVHPHTYVTENRQLLAGSCLQSWSVIRKFRLFIHIVPAGRIVDR